MANKTIDFKQIEKLFDTVTIKAVGLALEFIDDNFLAQGYQDKTLIPWTKTKSGKASKFGEKSKGILIKSGRLRRSFRVKKGKWSFVVSTNVPYAQAHNEGFAGVVKVKAHTRKKSGFVQISSIKTRKSRKKKVAVSTIKVQSHSRKMNLPQRQFIPTSKRGSATYLKSVEKMINKEIKKLNL